MDQPILDTHMHLDPDGLAGKAVREFVKAGGTHVIIANKPYRSVPINSSGDLELEYRTTMRMAEEAREAGAVSYCILGPHPVHYTKLLERFDRDKAHAIMLEGIELASRMVEKGDAVGIGEVGTPHFPVEDWVLEDSIEQLVHAMELASDIKCPVIIHASLDGDMYDTIAGFAKRAGLSPGKVVKHYSPPASDEADRLGIFLSILAKEDNITSALSKGRNVMLETDYIDDLQRPGAVLGPKTVPRTTLKMLEKGTLTYEQAVLLHVDNPKKVFDIDIE